MKKQRRYTLLGFLLEKRALLTVFVLATAALAVVAPLKTHIMQWLIDSADRMAALRYLGLGIVVVVASHVLEYASRVSYTSALCRCAEDIRRRLAAVYTGQTMQEILDQDSGTALASLTSDIKLIEDEYYMGIFNVAMWGSMGLVSLVMLAMISPVFVVLGILMALIPMMMPKLMGKRLSGARGAYAKDVAAYTGRMNELLKGLEALVTANAVDYFTQSHDKAARQNKEKDLAMRRTVDLATVFISLAGWIPNILILFVTVLLVFDGQITVGTLVTVNSLSSFVIGPARQASNAYANIKSSQALRKKLEDAMNREKASDGGDTIGKIDLVSMEHVSFTYPGAARPALKDVNLNFNKNEKVALVGPSGSGKSTIAKILYRYYGGYSGDARVDGLELGGIARQSYYQKAAMIPQTPFVFSDTIYNNLCLYQKYSDEAVRRAIERAGLKSFVDAQPEGWNTQLTENGRNLSGGQMQRIAAARAILRDSDLILVDEATSSLDVTTTCEVMENLLDLEGTVVVITHDIFGDYMRKFDRICYLENGEIQEQGSFDALLDRDGGFARLYRNLSQTK